jgi:hypothetical protein
MTDTDDYPLYAYKLVNWNSPSTSGWRIETKCEMCRTAICCQAEEASDQTREKALEELDKWRKRPICPNCEENLKKWGKSKK